MLYDIKSDILFEKDFSLAEVNKLIDPKLEYIYFRADNVAVSSSMVKELSSFGQDVSKYVPKAVFEIIQRDKK